MSATVADYRTEVQSVVDAWEQAANAKDAGAVAALYSENATLLAPGQPALKGRQNIQAFWQGFFDAGASDVKLNSGEVAGSGSLVYEIGEYRAMMPQPTGGVALGTGKYLVVYERQPDGKLKMAADMFSANA